eukprot:PDM69983.1 hypothetical protein PRIPAC_49195 [Pristionchus pacificus]
MTALEYEKDGIRMWRPWEVGVGKKVPYKNLIPNDARLFVEKSGGALSDDAFWVKMGDSHYIEKEEEHEEEEDEDAQCPIESCSQEFLPERNLEQHLDVGRHLRRPERMNIQDISLNRYASFLEIVAPPKVCHVIDEAIGSLFDDTNAMERKLSERKKSERFPDSVKSFLKKLYDEGKMEYASFPTDIARVDTGVESGDEVSVHYDPMIAKVIVHGRDRAAASAALDAALAKTTIVGLPTNISFVRRILTHPEFAAGNVYTEFIPDHAKELFREEEVSKAELLEGALAQALSARVSSDKLFSQLVPFRVNHQPVYTKKCGTKSVDLVQKDENTWEADIDGEKTTLVFTTLLVSSLSHSECGHELHFRVEADGEAWRTKAVRTESGTLVVVGKGEHTYEADAREWGDADGAAAAGGGHALAPMPGIVERILVKKGDVVKAGQALVVVVAMKMEYIIRASRDSVVEDVTCAPAQNVPRAAVLVKLTTADHP